MSGDNWETPDDLYAKLNEEFRFQFDLCASKDNAKCANWSGNIAAFASMSAVVEEYDYYWMNPPYSRGNIDKCIATATAIAGNGKIVVALVRFDPSADWFKTYVDGIAAHVRMLDRRVKFKGAKSAYPFPCCVVIYNGIYGGFYTQYYSWGWK